MFNSILRHTRRTLVGFAAAATFTAGFGIAENALAAPVSLTSTVASSGYNGGTLASMPLTADNSFGGGGGTAIPLPAGVWAGMAMLSSLGVGAKAKRMRKKS